MIIDNDPILIMNIHVKIKAAALKDRDYRRINPRQRNRQREWETNAGTRAHNGPPVVGFLLCAYHFFPFVVAVLVVLGGIIVDSIFPSFVLLFQ